MRRTSDGEWVGAAVRYCSGLPQPWGIGLDFTRIDHIATIVSIMWDLIHYLLGTEDGFVEEWDFSSGKLWPVLYPNGMKGRSRILPAGHGW